MTDNSRVRVSIVGVVIVALFSALVARLWFLQMGPERKLGSESVLLSTRTVQTESPRGRILDRNGNVLAQDRAAWAVTLDRNLNKATRERVLGQLSELLGVPQPQLEAAYASKRQTPLKPAVLKLDITEDARLALLEHLSDYPGVHIVQLTVREYPMAQKLNDPALASQLLGFVGEIDATQLKRLKSEGYEPGSLIGRAGIESAYESVLRGTPEIDQVEVDPTGRQIGPPTVEQRGSIGDDVYLTLDAGVQKAAEDALQAGILAARGAHDKTGAGFPAPGGAVVVLNARDGSVVAMASNPVYAPDDPRQPTEIDRATQGQYVTGSTFKLVSALAAMRYNIPGVGPDQYFDDTGKVHFGNLDFFNDNRVQNGEVNLPKAITVSSDTYFYTIGDQFWNIWRAGDLQRGLGLQQQARDLGFGAKTGIEVDEAPGRIPDPKWKHDFAFAAYKDPKVRDENAAWVPGDDISLAVGQKDLLVTPLQLANAYATFANGGALNTPHIGEKVVDPMTGRVVRTIAPKARAIVPLAGRDSILEGFKNVVQSDKGTAFNAFSGFPQLAAAPGGIAGKTGTAQVIGKQPTSVFASFFPADNPQYVVLALVEEAGHGAAVAAPIVRQVIENILKLPPTPIVVQSGND